MYDMDLSPYGASQVVLVVKNPHANAGQVKIQVGSLGWQDPLEEGMQPTPVLFPGESQGQRSLVGYSPWVHKRRTVLKQLNRHPQEHLSERIRF